MHVLFAMDSNFKKLSCKGNSCQLNLIQIVFFDSANLERGSEVTHASGHSEMVTCYHFSAYMSYI
jgi:hypothetical protein